MGQIGIRCRNDRVTHRELRYAAEWMLESFVGPYLLPNIRVTVHCIDSAKGGVEFYGDCKPLDRGPYHRRFKIQLVRTLSRWRQLQYLAHEIVHVKQWALGELYDPSGEARARWKNTWVSERVAYKNQPW